MLSKSLLSDDVITALVPTATNSESSADQTISFHALLIALLAVHVVPSGEVITRFVPLLEIATNNEYVADQHTDHH